MPVNRITDSSDDIKRGQGARERDRRSTPPAMRDRADAGAEIGIGGRRLQASVIASLLLLAVALIVSRHLGGAPEFIHVLLLTAPVAVAAVIGGLWPAVAATALSLAAAAFTPLADLGALSYAEVLLFDILMVACVQELRRIRSGDRSLLSVESVLRTILDNDTTGIVVLARTGRALYISLEAERICGPELRAGQGFEPLSPVRLATSDGRPISVPEVFAGFEPREDPAGAHRASTTIDYMDTRDLLVVRDDEQRTWIESRAVPIRVGGKRASLVALLMWDSQTMRRQQMEASLEESLRRRRDERDEIFTRISNRLRGTLDSRQIQSSTARDLGMAMAADRCLFLLFGVGNRQAVMGPHWSADGMTPIVDEYASIDIDVKRVYDRGTTILSSDIRSAMFPVPAIAVFENQLGIRSAINVPFFENDVVKGALIVAMANRPRVWNPDEVALVESVASQTRFAIEAARLLAAERSRAEREQMSNAIGNAVRSSIDPETIQFEATTALGKAIQADRCYYVSYRLDRNLAVIGPDYAGAPDIVSLAGQYDVGADLARELGAARNILVIEDVRECNPINAAAIVTVRSEPVRSFVRVPIFSERVPTGALIVTMTQSARTWTNDEVALVESVTTQTWSALTNALLIARESARAKREQLFSRISTGVGAAESAREASDTAVRLLGQALQADRCYLIQIEYYRSTAVIAGEYHRSDIAAMKSMYRTDDSDLNWLLTRLRSGGPYAAADVRRQMPEPASGEGLLHTNPHRGFLAIALFAGGQIDSVLVLASANRPRVWTEEEVSLTVEAVGHMRGALHDALTHEREHHIAFTLQEALLPSEPTELPGLDIATYYKAALRESTIGGDFYDAFAITPTKSVICIGDVSGKGLTAAAQLSSLRNMLRAMMYRGDLGVGQALEELNQIVFQHRLLTGFATLCVATYDEETRQLTYASCGHEPAILLRSAARTPEIVPTASAAIGLFDSEKFAESQIVLGAGDLLLLYTDGVSEAGNQTKSMLGTDGVAQVLAESAMQQCPDASGIVDEIVKRVEAKAAGVVRDDMCLLLARVSRLGG
jgi:serine phosphatase RsbU (regulator of sigma subunit)/PAS domain-containing protein